MIICEVKSALSEWKADAESRKVHREASEVLDVGEEGENKRDRARDCPLYTKTKKKDVLPTSSVCRAAPVVASQSWTVSSSKADASILPSGENSKKTKTIA